jgi:hypothetical protein
LLHRIGSWWGWAKRRLAGWFEMVCANLVGISKVWFFDLACVMNGYMAQIARIAVLPMLLALAALSTAQAAEPTGTLTLACKGTNIVEYEATHKKVSSQVTMGIIVDFQKKTVVGFTPGSDIPVMIKDVDETSISFEGHALNVIISGTIDRVTGTVVASIINGETSADSLELQCKPMQRMF